MDIRYTCGLLKPDCIRRGLVEKVLDYIERQGFEIVATKRVRLTPKDVSIVYAVCLGDDFYRELEEFFTTADSIAYILKGPASENAIQAVSRLVGNCYPDQAQIGTIRNTFGLSVSRNVIHSTENLDTFWAEISCFFSEQELCQILLGMPAKER